MKQHWALVGACLFAATSASAVAPQRTFVASYGVDTNPCSLTAPCRGFQAAINTVNAGGEVVALDSGGYGGMEIHKAVTVLVPTGIHAGLSPTTGIPLPGYPGQYGVVLIDIQDTDVVVLRGLNINHQGTVTGGIEWISTHGGTVQIENTVVNGFPGEGVYMQAPGGKLAIKESAIRNNGVGIYGAIAAGGGGLAGGGIFADHVAVENSNYGVRAMNGVGVALSNGSINSNGVAFDIQALTDHAKVTVDRCTVLNNQSYYHMNGSGFAAALWVSGSVLTTVGSGSTRSGSTYVWSLGNNAVITSFFDTAYPPQ